MARGAAFPSAQDICHKNVNEMMALIINCTWDTTAVAPYPIFKQTESGGIYTCKGRLVCTNADPYLISMPYEVRITQCVNGPKKCVEGFTSQCKNTLKQFEHDKCDHLPPPDTSHCDPGPPRQPPYNGAGCT